MDALHTCKSCGNKFTGNYCNQCGEKVLVARDRSFRHFLNTFLISITFADSSIIKSIWFVVSKPGFLATEFVEGRRVRYLNPLSFFLVLNLVYFFFPVIQLFNASLNTQLLTPLGHWYGNLIVLKMQRMDVNLSSFSLLYNIKTTSLAKLMVMIFVVLGSLPLNILYRKTGRFFTDHIDYVVELACYNLLINALLLTLLASMGLGKFLNEYTLTGIFVTTNLYFLIRSGKIFYRQQGIWLVLKSFLMIVFLKMALEVYRAILFFITLWSL
ncbi:MAG: DUF3667 domain-containing protein [Bacteroidetes bacterium]|nr:DUF3667 domain-containing protein [Bacteroidota bacterium]